VVDLKSGGETVETIARTDLGLIKAGETFYQIIEE
jgi:cell division protein FtsB